ncbi:PH domain-containing protein [Caldisalinibacter kiritimatiensis]|uniref:Bacterial Pleckstrin homology domain-containing protein n=1 Tax=Caldisalinibacter kiritimatiensis TaxID=1304284 RepID=R1AQB4_9FIRM|nr:PH domain-containing protein [Caldisalinibacter kiritimatiensis]EOC99317.1 hypothetical protein L21TH_2666 [Caldisalinibacter kiritimatiensis]
MGKGLFGNLMNGISGNLNQMDSNTAIEKYGQYLINDEEIQQAFTLIRDVVIFQGTTGKKMSVKSIFLMNIVDCEIETAGAGIDDSEITITYLTNVKRNSNYEDTATHKLEFPKKAKIEDLYRWLFSLAYKNRLEINGIK